MLIGLCGGICAGKHAVMEYLMEHNDFRQLSIKPPGSTSSTSPSRLPTTLKRSSSVPIKDGNGYMFESFDDLLEFATKRWHQRWITVDIVSELVLEAFAKRPFFLLISVDAPIGVRWNRYKHKYGKGSGGEISLEDFVAKNDDYLYNHAHGLASMIGEAKVRIVNSTSTLDSLYDQVGKLDLISESRLRPSWDAYFMELASLAALRSNCMKRRVGCVVVREKRVISTGYNGTPRGLKNCNQGSRCNDGHSSGQSLSTCLCLHAEENALLEAGRERIGDGATLYCDTCPCLTCSIKIAQVGISEVVYSQGYSMDQDTANVLRQGGVHLRQFSTPKTGLVYLSDEK